MALRSTHFGLRPPITDREFRLIDAITNRAWSLFPDRTRADIFLDISCVHVGPCPLRLEELLNADDFNFVHDVGGIWRHLDRDKFELRDCFIPRFAKGSDE